MNTVAGKSRAADFPASSRAALRRAARAVQNNFEIFEKEWNFLPSRANTRRRLR
jgi:hypothetical protein